MSKLSQHKRLMSTVTPEKPGRQRPFIQIEEKLTQEQLKIIAGGRIQLN